ncbi:hypothetical protein NMY22_g7735 [Coprinellus aureogranulatus]|nr:hypothetical protein NMY22_g7735 [Coprinellus aureogranulatus]
MSSYFQNAQNVVFQGTLINVAGNYVQGGRTTDPLQLLLNNITIGAMHNSEERSDAPKCHPDTRVAVQEEIVGWITDGDKDNCLKKVLWMTGPAGSGKTAIAGSIADLCKEKGLLAATFFFSSFSGSPGRSSKRRLIATIAYQLLQCAALEEVGKRILAVINRNPAIFGLRLKDQVEELILAPLRGARGHAVDATAPWPKAIVINGLDEAEPDRIDGVASDAQRARDETHLEILSALLYAAHDLDFPFRIVVISRPERAIRDFFHNDSAQSITGEIFLDGKYDPDADIALFFRSKFAGVRRRFNLPSPWPEELDMRRLVYSASGQFIYAATVVRYVSDPRTHPQAQLDRVLQLDPQRAIAIDMSVIQGIDSFPALFWRQFFESAPGEGLSLFSNLGSLISIPSPEDPVSPFRPYHKSFMDFFCESRIPRSHSIHVDWFGPDGVLEFIQDRWISVVKNKGPATPVTESQRDVFLTRFFACDVVWSMLAIRRSLELCDPGEYPVTARWSCHPHSQDSLLSSNAGWWAEQLFLQYRSDQSNITFGSLNLKPNTWPMVADYISGIFWDVHSGCPWYCCLPICKAWRGAIIREGLQLGWIVPGRWKLLRNRFMRWSRTVDIETGKKRWFIFPCGRDFIPPPSPTVLQREDQEPESQLNEETPLLSAS